MKTFVALTERDPKRLFSGQMLSTLKKEAGNKCSNPMCSFEDLPLEAHHIIPHSYGGLTVPNNGIILCKKCHHLAPTDCLPLFLIYRFKKQYKEISDSFFDTIIPLTPDEILYRVTCVATEAIPPHEKMVEINRLIIAANFIKNVNIKWLIFAEALLAKASILNDNIREVKSDYQIAEKGLRFRRLRVIALSTWAAWLAKQINAYPQYIRAIHFKSISYRALNKYKAAVHWYRHVLSFIEAKRRSTKLVYHPESPEWRLWSELAVNRTRISIHSRKAENDASKGIALSESEEGFHLALYRKMEVMLDIGNVHSAYKIITEILSNRSKLSPSIFTLALKGYGKLLLKTGQLKDKIQDVFSYAMKYSLENKLYHQEYQIWKLRSNSEIHY